jgi:predicted secreted protein
MATNNNNAKSANPSFSSNKAGGNAFNNFNQFQQMFSKQFESITAANQVVMEGGQNLARCYNDAAQNQMRQGFNLWRNSSAAGFSSPADMQENLKDFTTHTIQNCYNTANNMMESCTETATNLVSVYGEGLSNVSKEMISNWGNFFSAAKNNFTGNSSN